MTNTAPSSPPPTERSGFLAGPLAQLTLARLREFFREPEAIFWGYVFPLMMTAILGLAFGAKAPEKIPVDVQEGPQAASVVKALLDDGRFDAAVRSQEECAKRRRMRKSEVVVRPVGGGYAFEYEKDRPESLSARQSVADALQRAAGRKDPLVIVDQATAVRGGRYVDFLVPGLLGSGIMAGGMWGVGFAIVDMRIRKLLKRYLATPMKKRDFLAAILLSRLAFLLPEAAALLVFAYFFFGVTVAGSWLAVLFLVLLGSLAFSGIGLLVACRAKTIEAVSGLMNLVMVPLWICGGIFFSATNFPDEMLAIVRYLPMNAFLDALRPVMIDGLPLFDYWREILILAAWSVVTFALGLRRFRWN